MELKDSDTLVQLFFDRLRQVGDQPFLWEKKGNLFRHMTWKETGDLVNSYTRALTALGVRPADRVAVACPSGEKSFVSEMGNMCAGAVTLAVSDTSNAESLAPLLANTRAKVAIIASQQVAGELARDATSFPELEVLVSMEYMKAPEGGTLKVMTWQEFLTLGKTSPDRTLETIRAVKPSDSVSLIYELPHNNGIPAIRLQTHADMINKCKEALVRISALGIGEGEIILGATPFAHPVGHALAAWLPMILRGQIYFLNSMFDEGMAIAKSHPTMMLATAENFRTLREMVMRQMGQESKVDDFLLAKLLQIGKQHYEKPETLSISQKLWRLAFPTIIMRRILAQLGGRLKLMLSIDNDVDYETFLFFHALGIPLLEVESI